MPPGIQVTVRDGWVTLAGDVDWYYQRRAAEDNVRKLSGVAGVINHIGIRPPVEPGDVKRKIEDALKRNAEVEAQAIRVMVHNGNKVLLEGKVRSWDEKYVVENAAWSAPGVKSVEDRLAISLTAAGTNGSSELSPRWLTSPFMGPPSPRSRLNRIERIED